MSRHDLEDLAWFALKFLGWVLVALMVLFLIYAMVKEADLEQARWDKFKQDHKCVVVSIKGVQTVTGINTNGDMQFSTIPQMKEYACNNGMTYWREER